MEAYRKIREANHDKNDCTVVMVSVVCDIPYDEAFSRLKAEGRRNGKGCPASMYDKVIRDLGFNIEPLTSRQKGIYHSKVRDGIRPLAAKTVRTIERELARYWGHCKVYINVPGHILAWDGTECVDWTAGRQQRVRSAFLIYKGDLPSGGAQVAEPTRQSLNRIGHKRTGVMANKLGNEPRYYRSVAAAYKGMGLNLKGHQKIRQLVKLHGKWVFYAYRERYHPGDPWDRDHITITKIE